MEITRALLEDESEFIIRPKKHEPREFAAKDYHFVAEPDRETLKGHFEGKDRFYNAESTAIANRLPHYKEYKDDQVFRIPLENGHVMEISAYISSLVSQGDLMPNAEMKERVLELELSAYGAVLSRDQSVLELPWGSVFGECDIQELDASEIKNALLDAILENRYFFEKSFGQTQDVARDFDYI